MREEAKTKVARLGSRIIIGPWLHGSTERRLGVGNVDFGPDAAFDKTAIRLRWFDYWLKGIQNGIDKDALLRIFVMGDNKWRNEQSWPLERAKKKILYTTSDEQATRIILPWIPNTVEKERPAEEEVPESVEPVQEKQKYPLHHAAADGDNNIEMIKLLIANGADINAKTSLGQSPMQLAKPRRNTATIEVLRKYSNEKDGSSVKHDAFFLLPYLCKFMMIFGYASTRSGGKFLRRFLHPFAVLCV